MNKNIAIIGAGISGMSCAYALKDKNYTITIFAKAFFPEITSNKAAAFWFPYHIRNDRRGIAWCRESYAFYTNLCGNTETGISMKKLVKVLRNGVQDEELVWKDFMPPGALRMMNKAELAEDIAIGYEVYVPLIETQIFLPYLQATLKAGGVDFKKQEIHSLDELTGNFDIVINCSALGSRLLCKDDKLVPVRGQVALLEPCDMPVYLDNEKPLYVVPRKDVTIIGGTYEEGIETETTEPNAIERLLKNAYTVFPFLQRRKVLGSWAGLRPYRPEIRVEAEVGTNIIHNYGHGGSGFTLAFGCAKTVAEIVDGK